jgi:vesicle coat complex subunit
MENGLKEIAIDAVSDQNPKVRTEAIFAIVTGYNRQESIDILRPLLQDEDQAVITAANFALSRLIG